jgi:hypothetical protein
MATFLSPLKEKQALLVTATGELVVKTMWSYQLADSVSRGLHEKSYRCHD